MSILYRGVRALDRVFGFERVSAHCDIPCGIYDPHQAQMAAHTVVRMVSLIQELKEPGPRASTKERLEFYHRMARFTTLKEEHAELVKHEIRVLWGDYFKPEHLEEFPSLHELVWKVMKLGSGAKQDLSVTAAEALLEAVLDVAEVFWKTKGMEAVRVKSPYPTGGEIVLPG